MPFKLISKLRDLGLSTALCDWILNFLTVRLQDVLIGTTTSSTLTLITGARTDCGLQEVTEKRTQSHHHQWDYGGESQQLQVLRGSH